MVDYKKYKIKKKLQSLNSDILLLDMNTVRLPYESVANVVAIDHYNGEILWLIEKPQSHHDIYEDIYFRNNKLYAFTSGSFLHEINLETGEVIESKMIK